jgi:hypothetical protein
VPTTAAPHPAPTTTQTAGKHLNFEVTLETLTQSSKLQKVVFGAGCFWGPELAFMRVPGEAGAGGALSFTHCCHCWLSCPVAALWCGTCLLQ